MEVKVIQNYLGQLKPLGTVMIWSVLILFWINFLWQPWPWSWNPVDWLIFLRSGGPILFANHVSSALAVLSVATYFGIKNKKNSAQWILVVLSTASLHELIGIGETVMVAGFVALKPISNLYFADLGFVLGLALLFSTKAQKKMIGQIAVVCAIFNGAWIAMILILNIPTLTVNGFVPGPAFFDWRENSLEVASWIVPSVWWLRWRRQQ